MASRTVQPELLPPVVCWLSRDMEACPEIPRVPKTRALPSISVQFSQTARGPEHQLDALKLV